MVTPAGALRFRPEVGPTFPPVVAAVELALETLIQDWVISLPSAIRRPELYSSVGQNLSAGIVATPRSSRAAGVAL